MRRYTAILLAAGLLLTIMSGVSPTLGQEPAQAEIGRYRQLATEHELNENHVTELAGGLSIEGPIFTSDLIVATDFLRGNLGAWGADRAFVPGDGTAEFEGRQAFFRPLNISELEMFTWGAATQIQFLERPMWVSAFQEAWGEAIQLHMEDGDTTGQQIYVSKDWLWGRGIHRPNATHEDGSVLPVAKTPDGRGFIIDIHHFSHVVLNPAGLSVLKRDGSTVTAHNGVAAWHPHESKLEIYVPLALRAVDILIEKDWMDVNLPHPQSASFWFGHEVYQSESYYVVPVMSHQTPATVVFEAFEPGLTPVWTFGDPTNLMVHAFNDTMRLEAGPIRVSTIINGTGLSVYLDLQPYPQTIFLNKTYLYDLGIVSPYAYNPVNGDEYYFYETFARDGFVIERIQAAAHVVGGALSGAVEERILSAVLRYNITTESFDTILPLYVPYMGYGFNLYLEGLPWGQTIGNPGYEFSALEMLINNQTVFVRNATHFADGSPAPANSFALLGPQGDLPELTLLLFGPLNQLQENLQVGIPGTNDPKLAGIVDLIAEDCHTIVQRGYNTGWFPGSNRGNPLTGNKEKFGGLTTDFLFSYRNSCNGSWGYAEYNWGFSALGQSIMYPWGDWEVFHGAPIQGDTAPASNWRYHRLTVVEPSAVLLRPQLVDGPGGFDAWFQGLDNLAERRIECVYPDNGVALIAATIKVALMLSTRVSWSLAGNLIPEQRCWETLATYTRSLGSVTGFGGKVVKSSDSDRDDLGFRAKWAMGGWAGTHNLYTRVGGDFLIQEMFLTCKDDIGPCHTYQKSNTRYNWAPESRLRLVVPF